MEQEAGPLISLNCAPGCGGSLLRIPGVVRLASKMNLKNDILLGTRSGSRSGIRSGTSTRFGIRSGTGSGTRSGTIWYQIWFDLVPDLIPDLVPGLLPDRVPGLVPKRILFERKANIVFARNKRRFWGLFQGILYRLPTH